MAKRANVAAGKSAEMNLARKLTEIEDSYANGKRRRKTVAKRKPKT